MSKDSGIDHGHVEYKITNNSDDHCTKRRPSRTNTFQNKSAWQSKIKPNVRHGNHQLH